MESTAGDELLNVDETGFDLCSCTKTQRVVKRCTQYKKQPKAMHEGSADRSHFAAAVCIDETGHRYKTKGHLVGETSVWERWWSVVSIRWRAWRRKTFVFFSFVQNSPFSEMVCGLADLRPCPFRIL